MVERYRAGHPKSSLLSAHAQESEKEQPKTGKRSEIESPEKVLMSQSQAQSPKKSLESNDKGLMTV